MFIFNSFGLFKLPQNFNYNFKNFFKSMLFKDNTLSFFFNRLLSRKAQVGSRHSLSKSLLITSSLSLNTSSSLTNLRTYHYFLFFKLNKKKFNRGFFSLSSLTKLSLSKPLLFTGAAVGLLSNNINLRYLPSLLYKSSPSRRYFISFFFTTHLQKESLTPSRYFSNPVTKNRGLVFKGISIFNWSS
jgi:hypothetical protein